MTARNGRLATSPSLEIAELTGKQHKHVMRDTRKMFAELGKEVGPFLGQRADSQGKTVPHFAFDRFHTEVLITGYDIKRRAAIIERWYKLESGEAVDLAVPRQCSAGPRAAALSFLT